MTGSEKKTTRSTKRIPPKKRQFKDLDTSNSDFEAISKAKVKTKKIVPSTSPPKLERKHFLKSLNERSVYCRMPGNASSMLLAPIVNQVKRLGVCKTVSPFDRRATAMVWHPSNPTVVTVGSKSGDVILWDYMSGAEELPVFLKGIGKGGQVLAMKYHPRNSNHLYTAGVDGKVMCRDLLGTNNATLLNTMDLDKWFCSMDISQQVNFIAAGDTEGIVTLLSSEGKKIWSHRLHKGKVTHAEFSKLDSSLLVTASNDSLLKIWDVRSIKGRNDALHVLEHKRPINSAYFSMFNGSRLLTTDQNSEIRIYRAPLWDLERVIMHPHRQFQHLTAIKASWHPLADIIVIGRYPDGKFKDYTPGELRGIDFFDGNTGKLIYQLNEQGVSGIISLNQFNSTGEVLASCMGYNILAWKDKLEFEEHIASSNYVNGKTFRPKKVAKKETKPKGEKVKKLK